MYCRYTFMKIKVGAQRSVQKSNFRLILILQSHNIKNKDDLYYREIWGKGAEEGGGGGG